MTLRQQPWLAGGLTGLVLAGACSQPPPRTFTRFLDSADVTIAVSEATDRAPPWEVTEVRRLGGADTGALAFFVRPGNVTADLQGRIYVLHDDLKRIDILDTLGTLGRGFGREGEGPGELRMPAGLHLGLEGTVWVTDYVRAALVAFDTAGAILPQVPFTRTGFPFGGVRVTGDTVLLDARDYEGDVPVRTLRLIRPGDTLELARLESRTPMSKAAEFRCPDGVRITMNGLPRVFDPGLAWEASGDVVVVTRQASYEVRLFRRGGLGTVIRREIAPEPATAAHVERLYPEGRPMGRPTCVVPPSVLVEQQGVAETLPLIDQVALAPDGSVWVERFAFPDEADRIDVFAADGVYRGTIMSVPLPAGFLPNGQFVSLLDHPESGGQILGIYRLTPAPW